jgi:hypothetical protein
MGSDWNAIVLAENFAETATLSGGSYSTEFPLTNLQSRRQKIVARTTDATLGSTIIIAALTQREQVRGVCVCNGNWTLTALARVELSNVSDFSVLTYDSGWDTFPGFVVDSTDLEYDNPDFWTGVLNDTLLTEFPKMFVHIIPDDDELDGFVGYIRVSFNDTANPDGYLQYGYLDIAKGFQPQVNYSDTNSASILPLSDMSESLGGQRTWFERGLRRTWSANFALLENDELFRELTRVSAKRRDSRPVIVVPDQTDLVNFQYRSFLASAKTLPAIQQLLGPEIGATALAFEEFI